VVIVFNEIVDAEWVDKDLVYVGRLPDLPARGSVGHCCV